MYCFIWSLNTGLTVCIAFDVMEVLKESDKNQSSCFTGGQEFLFIFIYFLTVFLTLPKAISPKNLYIFIVNDIIIVILLLI